MNKNQVSIIIPCYNKADTIDRAINRAMSQTYKDIEIIIVDDGSTDNSRDVILSTIKELKSHKVSHLFTDNQGVANARNNCILVSQGEYICCLDADDWLDPEFVEICVNELIADNTLGISYTKLMTHLPNDSSQISEWPGEFNADKQFSYKARQNQIPTCCVFRREGFDRVGGYRQRYAPHGAGSEDAAFWTALLATGYTAKLVSNKALFHYSAFSGNVSGNKDYREMDWLAFYPYTRTGNHPFSSPATPSDLNHTVRDYSEPIISIVVPVGEGHTKYLQDCIDSVEAQNFWQWELIVVDDTKDQAIDALWFMSAYPYAKIHKTGGKRGAGVARNLGVDNAKGDFLLFLDADDMINPALPEALGMMLSEFERTGDAIYSDYIGRSFVEDVSQLDPKLQGKIIRRDDDTETYIYHKVYPYRCDQAILQPKQDQAGNIYNWCNISTLIPKTWHDEIGGFDEEMPTWEDVDYWWRIAKMGHCFSFIDEPYLIYRFYSGTRREKAHEKEGGRFRWENVLNYLKDKHKNIENIENMGCNCGNKKQNTVKLPDNIMRTSQEELTMNDSDFVLIEFTPTYTGVRPLNSPTGKRTPDGKILEYGGYARKSGDKFLVHKDDRAARPDLFKLVTHSDPKRQAPQVPTTQKLAVDPPKFIQKNDSLKVFDLNALKLNDRQRQALLDDDLTTPSAIQEKGFEGITALDGFGKVSAGKLLDALR